MTLQAGTVLPSRKARAPKVTVQTTTTTYTTASDKAYERLWKNLSGKVTQGWRPRRATFTTGRNTARHMQVLIEHGDSATPVCVLLKGTLETEARIVADAMDTLFQVAYDLAWEDGFSEGWDEGAAAVHYDSRPADAHLATAAEVIASL